MSTASSLWRVGIVGVGGRRAEALAAGLQIHDSSTIYAVCDLREDILEEAAVTWGASEQYTSYEQLLTESGVDAVVLVTPPSLHGEQARNALRNDVHVLSEVPAVVSLDGARELVSASGATDATYMMAENINYIRDFVVVRELVAAGQFGDVYYAESSNLVDARPWLDDTAWRRDSLLGRNGITYPTHQLGPILQWFSGDRISEVHCTGTGHHYADADSQPFEQEDTTIMFGRTSTGKLVKLRQDFLSRRPPRQKYQLQGTKGCFEAQLLPENTNHIWLQEHHERDHPHDREFHGVAPFEEEFLPDRFHQVPSEVDQSSRLSYDDYITVGRFLERIEDENATRFGVHDALDLTLPGIVSQESIASGGAWVSVPDSRDW